MADLIDRKAVMDYLDLREHDATERDWRSGANEISRIRAAIAALEPAEAIGVEALVKAGREQALREATNVIASYLAAWDDRDINGSSIKLVMDDIFALIDKPKGVKT